MKPKSLYKVTYDVVDGGVNERRTVRTIASSPAQAESNARYREGLYKPFRAVLVEVEEEDGGNAVEQ